MHCRGGGRIATLAFCATTICAVALTGIGSSTSAGASGILPPANPLLNIAPSSNDFLTSIDSARALEGVGPMDVSESAVSSLPIPEQVFIIVNLERIDRGLPAISNMTAQLNADAQNGADAGGDPGFPTSLSGGSSVSWGGSIWAGGLTSVFEADYYWMYSDGWGGLLSTTTNAACTFLTSPECWGHRDIILHSFAACSGAATTLSMGAAYSSTGFAGGSIAALMVSSCGAAPTDVTLTWNQVLSSVLSSRVIGIAPLADGQGYWEAEANGTVGAFGQAVDYGSMAGQALNSPIVGIAATPDGGGYWLVAADGGIFTFGDAQFFGSTGSLHLVEPIVGMTSTPDGGGYWMVAADGGIFAFGDAPFRGSMGGKALNQPIVGMASDQGTDGYWLVAADGGIFSFGAPFFGSTGSIRLNKPIVGMEALANGQGYRFEASDGGVFCFGQAGFDGSMGGQSLVAAVVGMATDTATGGYWLVAQDGGVFSFGGANYFGRLLALL
jgi:hypothetical protein